MAESRGRWWGERRKGKGKEGKEEATIVPARATHGASRSLINQARTGPRGRRAKQDGCQQKVMSRASGLQACQPFGCRKARSIRLQGAYQLLLLTRG